MQSAATPVAPAAQKVTLGQNVPLIRKELRLIPAAHNEDGSPAWMVQDPICNKFYRIGWLDFEILVRWPLQQMATIVDAVNDETTLHIDEDDIKELIAFLQFNQLLISNTPDSITQFIRQNEAKNKGILSWLLHHYLFFRIPIFRPQKFLASLLPFVQWIFSPTMAVTVLAVTLLGLFLAAREWDTFQNTFIDQLTLTGILSYGVALIFSKCLHEMGHALTATRYGVRVAHMGVALLVMFPMPYTDTSESWKLTNPLQRLHIASAGIITELALAGFATLAWSLAPEGHLKDALFFLATTSWVLTLIINLSPFLRFDGYFILSDILDFPNLHERSGALAKTALRKTLLGFEDEWPEDFPPKKRNSLVVFALVTWLYRLVVFLGIALLVYYFFFKVLGIILLVVELLWFIVLPIWKEISVYYSRRSEIKANRITYGAILLAAIILLGLVPWQTSVKGAGWIHANQQTSLFTPIAGKLTALHQQGAVTKGEVLFQLDSPDIALQASRALALSKAREQQLRGLTGVKEGESQRARLQGQQAQYNAEVKLYEDELSRLSLVAPFSGQLLDIDDQLTVGTWVNPEQKLAMLINPNSWIVDVLIDEENISRLQLGDEATIYLLRSHLKSLTGTVTEIDSAARVKTLPHPMLDSTHGGPIATLPGSELTPKQSLVKIQVTLDEQPNLQSVAVGNVHISTQARALLPTMVKYIAAIFIRESGF